jgi:hypothetical protein
MKMRVYRVGQINFKGQAKRYNRSSAVGPEDVSRLVARLQRGEYGVFITTSYYTKAAQEEIYEDNYPVRLFTGRGITFPSFAWTHYQQVSNQKGLARADQDQGA